MADILIKGMEMPESCYYCPMKNDGYYLCKATRPYKELEDDCKECKPQWCPLVPVQPHGRLIDADALLDKFEKESRAADEHGRDFSFCFKSGNESCAEWWAVEQMVEFFPTVIPADREE
jgi:hypothetical protein